jgi:hypothetical protein
MKIDVKDNAVSDIITINLQDVTCCIDAITKPNLLFWLSSSEADKLIFQLQAILQDRARRYGNKELAK